MVTIWCHLVIQWTASTYYISHVCGGVLAAKLDTLCFIALLVTLIESVLAGATYKLILLPGHVQTNAHALALTLLKLTLI